MQISLTNQERQGCLGCDLDMALLCTCSFPRPGSFTSRSSGMRSRTTKRATRARSAFHNTVLQQQPYYFPLHNKRPSSSNSQSLCSHALRTYCINIILKYKKTGLRRPGKMFTRPRLRGRRNQQARYYDFLDGITLDYTHHCSFFIICIIKSSTKKNQARCSGW